MKHSRLRKEAEILLVALHEKVYRINGMRESLKRRQFKLGRPQASAMLTVYVYREVNINLREPPQGEP